jgi:hypothetical protein
MILLLAFISGCLGRAGGAKGYNTNYRDIGCAIISAFAILLLVGWSPLVILAVFILQFASFRTYWQFLFNGKDNMWMSGAMCGLAWYPIVFIDEKLFILVLARAIILCLWWGCLNKFLPAKVLVWRRDVAEEFSRYFMTL